MKFNSLELRWINKRAKDLFYPNIIYLPKLENASGCFYYPQKKEIMIENKFYNLSRGLLLISEESDSLEVANTIAHEWRHCWQFYETNKRKFKNVRFNNKIFYENAIKYFFKNVFEKDALLFSHKIAPSPLSDYWIELIQK